MDQTLARAWTESGGMCPNCGKKQHPPDAPDVGLNRVEVNYLCEDCGMGLEVSYTLDEVQVTQQPEWRKQTPLAALCDILGILLTSEKVETLNLPSKEDWVELFENEGIHSMEDLTKMIDRRVLIKTTV